jgi:hypothetical protein
MPDPDGRTGDAADVVAAPEPGGAPAAPPPVAEAPPRWERRLLLAATVFAVAVFVFDFWRCAGYLIDDTFISFRYARNLVDGHGLVFNPGERVEGYTNFLFVLLSALSLRLGIDPVVFTKVVSLIAAAAVLVLMPRMERFGPRLRGGALPVSVLLLLPLCTFAYWSFASFETMLFAALLAVALYLLLRESRAGRGHGSAFAFVALSLTRPEGVPLFAVASGVFWAIDALHEGARRALRRYAVNAAVFAAGCGPYFAWRWWYYGDPLPNTFYAKVTGGSEQLLTGLRHFGMWVQSFPLLAAALLLPLGLLSGAGREVVRRHPAVAAFYLIALAHTVYIVSVGGDFMPYYRFFLPILPLYCLLLAWTLGALAGRSGAGRRAAGVLLPAAVLIGFAASHATTQPYVAFVSHRTTVVGERVGRWFRRHLAPGDLMAVNTAGAIPYESELPTIDMLGLTDAHIAHRQIFIVSSGWAGHRRGWGEYVVRRRPRVILWYNTAGSREPFYLGDHELADNPYFRFFYRPRTAHLAVRDGNGPPQLLARFLGDPFEVGAGKEGRGPDLGLRADVHEILSVPYTEIYDAPVTLNYFELDPRDDDLWPLAREYGPRIDAFVDAVADRWRVEKDAAPPPDPAARRSVQALCAAALAKIRAGDYETAKSILANAVHENGAARSPLVYQYVANVGAITGDLFVAVGAQKEALRLAPDLPLYRANLKRILTTPYEKAAEARER